jgi:hypothetical protein
MIIETVQSHVQSSLLLGLNVDQFSLYLELVDKLAVVWGGKSWGR